MKIFEESRKQKKQKTKEKAGKGSKLENTRSRKNYLENFYTALKKIYYSTTSKTLKCKTKYFLLCSCYSCVLYGKVVEKVKCSFFILQKFIGSKFQLDFSVIIQVVFK